MTTGPDLDCPWAERVSAWLDGELPGTETELVATHAGACPTCRNMGHADLRPTAARSTTGSPGALLPDRVPTWVRIGLGVVGGTIVLGALPDFVRGNTQGDALHDLRHLAMWQAAAGLSVIVAAFSFLFSRILAVMLGVFLALTVVASIYDLVTGHQGPWTDPVHIVEVAAGVLVLRMAQPRLRFLARARRADPATTPVAHG